MLILARKKDQVIKIGDQITITVIEIGDGSVRLGIDAPRSMPIHRLEIYEAIERENKQAATVSVHLADLTQNGPIVRKG